MKDFHPESDEVDQLLLNAQLRNDLEPFVDESLDLARLRHMPTAAENDFLASMLAWERAPVLPIAQWFDPELCLAAPDGLQDGELHKGLWDTINQLYSQHIVLDFTDHLSDRALYCLIYRDILPSSEKKIDQPKHYLHWDCLDAVHSPEDWLRYYASRQERSQWATEADWPLPPSEPAPFPRKMPRRAL